MLEHSNPAVAGAESGSAESAPGNKNMEVSDAEEFPSDDEPSVQQPECGSNRDFEAWVLDGGCDILEEMSNMADPKSGGVHSTRHLEARGRNGVYATQCYADFRVIWLFLVCFVKRNGARVGSSVKGI